MNKRFLFVSFVASLVLAQPSRAVESPTLWEIGKPDESNAEFALAPGQYAKYQDDGFFLVGVSEPGRDWPYVHPGPGDGWAGQRSHTFAIRFGLLRTTNQGNCQLHIRLLDTHSGSPPKLGVQVNDQAFEQTLPPGAGDASVQGKPEQGRKHEFSLTFPASLLKPGENQIQLTTLAGCWLLYDWIGLETPEGFTLSAVTSRSVIQNARPIRALREIEGQMTQPIQVTVRHLGDETLAILQAGEGLATPVKLTNGAQTIEWFVPAVAQDTERKLTLAISGRTVSSQNVVLKPVQRMTVYILPHSHTDIGYTDLQTAIEARQVNNLAQGMEIVRKTAEYPEGARFVWNVEVAWAADLYLRRLSIPQRLEFLQAVKRGQVALNGMYLNELTGLCRPEELLRLFHYAAKLGDYCGTTIDSVMISDVPGYTWGTVTAMAHAGIKYFSTAPNYFDRIGTILKEWENRPFYWVGPDGQSEVLVWIPYRGYALSHMIHNLTPAFVDDFLSVLEKTQYPYDIAHLRWSGHGDNATPDPSICEFVKHWNTHYAWPRFQIASVSTAFGALEQRYGPQLPRVRGDWTPYWEDGAGSSARETALNRASADRLAQAETLFALRQPHRYPATEFEDAWNQVLLYSEHTWGAWCSVSGPERKETLEQWAIKKSYADDADQRSRLLLSRALAPMAPAPRASAVDVFNTLSWKRSGLVTLPPELSANGDRVIDSRGKPVPSQRLASGELVFLAREVPPFAALRFATVPGAPHTEASVAPQSATLDNGFLRVRVDEQTGGIVELSAEDLAKNLADTSRGEALNDYLYLMGDNPADVKRNGPAKLSLGEPGPLVASLVVESEAPGCRSLRREIRMTAGSDFVELLNTVDKERLVATNYFANSGKESVNFAFPFNVRNGDMRLELPFAIIRPELDQMPSACKNWFTVGRWADVSDAHHGVTWVTLDAPLVQVGGLTATLLNSQTNPAVWRNRVDRTQRLYSWAMNNHWGTNYRAYQDGPVLFRFILRPHGVYDPVEATRFGMERSFPLIAAPASGASAPAEPRLIVRAPEVLATALKPSDDGQALILRLFGASGSTERTRVQWIHPPARSVFLSDVGERAGPKIPALVTVPGSGLISLRAEIVKSKD
jgi:hypothetical protein